MGPLLGESANVIRLLAFRSGQDCSKLGSGKLQLALGPEVKNFGGDLHEEWRIGMDQNLQFFKTSYLISVNLQVFAGAKMCCLIILRGSFFQ